MWSHDRGHSWSTDNLCVEENNSTPVTPVFLYNVGSEDHGHNLMRHFEILALLSMFSELEPVYPHQPVSI